MKLNINKNPLLLLVALLLSYNFSACSQEENIQTLSDSTSAYILTKNIKPNQNSIWNSLTKDEAYVIEHKGTEYPNSGKYVHHKTDGIYICKRCDYPLFNSESKFESGTGWPSFDDMIEDHVSEITDIDGYRTEIVCGNCQGHLGHVFKGESFTSKKIRHCVNSISLNFIQELDSSEPTIKTDLDTAIFASGCFWGTEYFFEKTSGVISTQVGYIGGHKNNPTYKEVCNNTTGHTEAVRVIYDPKLTDFETLAKLFFETHDPSQLNRQGPDIGTQYRTGIFYLNNDQRLISEQLKKQLEDKGIKVVTEITKATQFWNGEDYHENYYSKKGGTPYCHGYTKRF